MHQPFNSSPGIYFDPIGELKVSVGHLDVVTSYDISYIASHIQNINAVIGTTRFYCNHFQINITYQLECHNVLEPLTIRYKDIVSAYSSITHLTGTNKFKRSAWIGAVGTLSKTIFGTLNEDDAIKYDNAIRDVHDNQKKLASLIKDNILVTTSTFSKFNESLHTIKTNEIILNQGIENLTSKYNNLSRSFDYIKIKSNINSILQSLEAAVLTLSFQLEDIINAIVFSSQNILHPAIITPTQLFQELIDNHRYLADNRKLPTTLEISNIHVLMNVSSVMCFSLSNKIIFILRIPLVSPKEYSLYHNIPLPTPHDSFKPNSFIFVVPNSKYIALAKDKLEYCYLDSLTECKTINSREFICDVITVFSTSANPSCESELLSNVISALPTQCKTDFIYGHLDLWKAINNNKWIYVQSQSNKLFFECNNNNNSELNILGTGIVKVPMNCYAYSKGTKLIPKAVNVKINFTTIHPDFDIIKDSCCTLDKFKNEMSNGPLIKLQNVDLDTFSQETKYKLKSLAEETEKIINQKPIIKYGDHYSIILIIIIITILMYVIFRLFLYIKSRNRLSHQIPIASQTALTDPPTPIPPTQSPVIPIPTNEVKQTPEAIPPANTRRHL